MSQPTKSASSGIPPESRKWKAAFPLAAMINIVLLIAAFAVPSTAAVGGVTAAAVTPIRAAFYYPWFPETEHWSTHYSPSLGKYNSSDMATLNAHVSQAKYAGLDAFVSSYWGKASKTAQRLPLLLNAARAQNFHITPYYEPESNATPPTSAALRADFDALAAVSKDSAWLTVGGKPVLFTYNTGKESSCAGVDRIMTAAGGRFYINAKVFSGYLSCATQPDSWHQYGPAAAYDQQGALSATVSPGFYKFNESGARLSRDITRFKSDLARQVASEATWQLVTTFNEWGEGTSVESAAEWRSPDGMGTAVVCAWENRRLPVRTMRRRLEQFGSGQAISASLVIQSLGWLSRCLAAIRGSTAAME